MEDQPKGFRKTIRWTKFMVPVPTITIHQLSVAIRFYVYVYDV